MEIFNILYIIIYTVSLTLTEMASGSARAPTVAAAASPAAIMLTCLQDTQARLRRIETKQGQLQSSLEELRELVKKTQVTNFKVKGSPFQVWI